MTSKDTASNSEATERSPLGLIDNVDVVKSTNINNVQVRETIVDGVTTNTYEPIVNYIKYEETLSAYMIEYAGNMGSIYHDLSFQRKAIWTKEGKKSYIELLLNGNYPGVLMFADIEGCRKNNTYAEYFDDLIEYGKEKDRDLKRISIDGGNRSVAIWEFINDKFKVQPKGCSRACYFSDLPSEVRDYFLNIKIPSIVYTDVSHDWMAEIFVSFNQSAKLSAQEERNAKIGEISKFMRDYEPLVRDYAQFFNKENRLRKNDEEILKLLALTLDYTKPAVKGRLDYVWNRNLDSLTDKIKYLKKGFNLLRLFLGESKYRKRHQLAATIDLFILLAMLRAEGDEYESEVEKNIVKSMAKRRDEVFNTHKVTLGDDTEMLYSNLVSAQPFNGLWYATRLETLRKHVINPTLIELEESNIKPKGFRPQGLGTGVRHQLAIDQDFICSITGSKILDWQDTSKWEVDHIVPIALGGTNSMSNLQLVCKIANRSKGKKI